MSDWIRVRPAEGALVRDELTRAPITAGQVVMRTRAIARRLRDGDLIEEGPAEDPTAAAPEQPSGEPEPQPEETP